jgi:hypothetical protein
VRRRKQRGVVPAPLKATDSVRWLEAVVSDAKMPGANSLVPVKLRLAGGAWIEVSQLSQVGLAAALAQALEKSPTSC